MNREQLAATLLDAVSNADTAAFDRDCENIVFLLREKKLLDENCQDPDYIMYLEQKQEKSKHPQKKNYYLYLFCIVLCANGQVEKVERLLPFLRDDALLGVYKSDF